jgi:phage recombination protein Bet
MSTSLQTAAAAELEYGFEPSKLQLIKDTIAKGTTDQELQLFLYTCQRTGLDPLAKQIYCIKRWDATLQREVATPQTSIDGYRLIADRTGNYAPGRAPTYEESEGGGIFSATAYVMKWVRGTWHEVSATAYWNEYVQTKKGGQLMHMWATKPRVMLGKCAETLALRRAFPAELSGIYTNEEMPEPEQQPSYLDTRTGEIVEKPVKQLTANPPTNRVLTPDPAAAKAKLWQTFDAVVRQAKTLGIKVQDAELLQAKEDASEAEVIEMGKQLRQAIGLAQSINAETAKVAERTRGRQTEPEDEDTGSFVEVAENVELFPNGVPA